MTIEDGLKAGAIYRRVEVRMWGDARFRRLSRPQANGQSLFVYLLTGPHSTVIPGLSRVGRPQLADELDWSLEAFDEAFDEVSHEGMAKADWSARVLWIPKAIKRNLPQSPNVVLGWRSAAGLIPECELKEQAIRTLRESVEGIGEGFAEAFDKVFHEGIPQSGSGAGTGSGRKKKKARASSASPRKTPRPSEPPEEAPAPPPPDPRPLPSDAALDAADELRAALLRLHPEDPRLGDLRWSMVRPREAEQLEALHAEDPARRPWGRIEAVIRWLVDDVQDGRWRGWGMVVTDAEHLRRSWVRIIDSGAPTEHRGLDSASRPRRPEPERTVPGPNEPAYKPLEIPGQTDEGEIIRGGDAAALLGGGRS